MLLSNTPVLALYNRNARTIVSVDTSSHKLGAVLLQEQMNGDTKPVSYISRSLSLTEEQYALIEKETPAFIWACECISNFSGWRKVQYPNEPQTAESFVQH